MVAVSKRWVRRMPHPIIVEMRKAREFKGLSQEGLAKSAGYHKNAVQFAELGYSNPSMQLVCDCLEVMGLELRICFRR